MTMTPPIQQTPTTSLIPATTLTSLVSTKSVIASTPVYTAPTKVTTTQAWIKHSIGVTHITSSPGERIPPSKNDVLNFHISDH